MIDICNEEEGVHLVQDDLQLFVWSYEICVISKKLGGGILGQLSDEDVRKVHAKPGDH